MHKSHFVLHTAAFSILALLAFQTPLMACGTVDGWIFSYRQGEKYKALFHMLDCSDSYQAPADDIALLPIVEDALNSSSKVAELGAAVFKHYNHLWGARQKAGYREVLYAVSGIKEPERLGRYRGWVIITARSGANMRAKPSLQGRVITSLKYGMQAQMISRHGEWVKLKAVGPGSVDPRFERKQGYVHESLLAPY